MKKQLIIVGIIVLLVVVGLSGCTNNPFDTEKNKFIGTWVHSESYLDYLGNIEWTNKTITFFSDGTCIFPNQQSGVSGTWTLKDGKIVCTVNVQGQSQTFYYDYSLSNDGKTLTVTDQNGFTYTLTKS